MKNALGVYFHDPLPKGVSEDVLESIAKLLNKRVVSHSVVTYHAVRDDTHC